MRAISLWQPWASLWLTQAKLHETRHWAAKYTGWLAVHAAKRVIDDYCDEELEKICIREFGPNWRTALPRGAIVGAVELVGCWPAESVTRTTTNDDRVCGDFSAGRWAWQRTRTLTIPPIPWRGQQAFFDVPADDVTGLSGLAIAGKHRALL